MKTIERGDLNEKLALDHLVSHGLKFITANYHSRYGEIDLVMLDKGQLGSGWRSKGCLVFVEVRYRRADNFGGAAMSVTPNKQRKIALTAMQFLQKNKKTEYQCRFDVVAISETKTEWIKNAFSSPLT